jgi:chemotaxis protein MotB
MRRRGFVTQDHDATREIWPAFTDVMSTLALILFVLVLLAYVREMVSAKRLGALGREIAASSAQLRSAKEDLRRTAAEATAQRAALDAARAQIAAQESVLADSNHQLDALRSQLSGIAVLRLEVLNKLKQAIEAELRPGDAGGPPLVSIGDNGNVVLNESLVFESGSYALKSDAKPLLAALAKALGNLLADPGVRENIDAVVIQGHADERGSSSFNWELSAKRATAVLDYLFALNPTLADPYGRYFGASAYSKFRPLHAEKTPAAYQANRRIEIAVIPKDESVRRVIDDYMKSVGPTPPPAPGPP